MKSILFNPYVGIAFSFLLGGFFYQLRWSSAYVDLNSATIYVLFLVVVVMLALGILLRSAIKPNLSDFKTISKIWLCIYVLGITADFLYSGAIPMINMISGRGAYYKDIAHLPGGIYVLVKSLGAYLTIFYFCEAQNSGKKSAIVYFSLCFLLLVLGVNRGILVIIVFSCLLIYINKLNKFSSKKIFKMVCLVFFFLFLFGKVGEIRSNNYKNVNYISKYNLQLEEIILHKGQATAEFRDSNLPVSFFWVYAYAASPIGNLDSILESSKTNPRLDDYFMNSFAPDFIQSLSGYDVEKDKSSFNLDVFNAYTIFGTPAQQFGVKGILVCFLIMVVIIFLLLSIIQRTPNRIIPYAILVSASYLSVFANMFQSDIVFFSIMFSFLLKFKITRNYDR